MAMRGRGLVKVGSKAFDGRAGLGAQEIAKFGAGLIEEKRLGNCRGIICSFYIASPLFSHPGNLVCALWGAFLCDDDNCSYVGGEDICEMPEMVDGEVFEQVCAFFGSIGSRQEWIGKDQAHPAMGAHYLQP